VKAVALAWLAVLGCGTTPEPEPDPPPLLDTVWGAAIHRGDLIVAVPGTGGYTGLGALIDNAVDPTQPGLPVVDGRGVNAIVLEQAIGAAQRAGFSTAELEAGAVTLGLWGAGVVKTRAFAYTSLGGLHVQFAILGGESTCAVGEVPQNILHYQRDSADKDADDLYVRTQAFLSEHPAPSVTIVAHSWGGAVVEWLVMNRAAFVERHGALPIAFIVAAGVPGAIAGATFFGPTLRTVDGTRVYETDRPDDPVHALDPSGDIEGHQYDIVVGDRFLGSYGITTTELSCRGVAGPCG
jgi:hypothetical protein